jgi:hypothetical protein
VLAFTQINAFVPGNFSSAFSNKDRVKPEIWNEIGAGGHESLDELYALRFC